MPDDPKPQPIDWQKYSWLATPASIVLAAVIILAGPRYLPSVDPQPAPPVVIVEPKVEPVKIDQADAIATLNGIRLDNSRTKLLCDLVNAGEGQFVLRYQPVGKAEITRTVVVSGGVVPVPPIPVPPEPPKPPVPPDPPQPTGPLTILLVRESGDSTPEMAMLIRDLRTGPVADYLKSKMHALGVLDTNAKDPDGKPSPAVEEWRPHFSGLTLPALVVYDPTTKRVLSKQAITPATTATQIMEAIKKDGG